LTGSSVTVTNVTTNALDLSTLSGSTLTANNLIISALDLSTLSGSTVTVNNVTTSGLSLSTLSGSTVTVNNITASALDLSTLSGSTLTTNNVTTSGLNLSTLLGSTVTVNHIITNGLNLSTLTGSTVTVNNITATTIGVSTLDVNTQLNRVVPFIYRYQNATINIPDQTDTVLEYQVSDGTSQGTTGITYNAGVFTNTSGRTIVISVSFSVYWLSLNSTGARTIYILLTNGSSTRRLGIQGVQSNASDYTYLSASAVFRLDNNDSFVTRAWQNSGITLPTSAESTTSIQIAVL
jgi:hypothetical protein